MQPEPVIYEVRLEIEAGIIDEYDAWLAGHVEEMLAFPGFVSADVLQPEKPAAAHDAPELRIVQYRLASRADLDRYFEEHAARMREQGLRRFGERFSATREIYAALPGGARGDKQPIQTCRNCATPVTGQYCANCGQRNRDQIISLWQLLRDLIGDLFEVDSRLWRTLRPLMFQPGRLTNEYLRGRRVHYTPPLRLYLATSLIFFLVVFFGAGSDTETEVSASPADAALEETSGSGDPPEPASNDERGETDDEPGDRCMQLEFGAGTIAAFLEKRGQRACRRLSAEGGGKQFVRDLVDNVPGMMFIFLPAIALAMMLLYPLSRRYYVEHLLFFVHYHSFFYVILTIAVLLSRLPGELPGQGLVSGLFIAVTSIYIPVYLFVAMRRVYRQSRLVTALKYAVLGFAYVIGLALTFGLVAAFTALSA